MENFFLNKLNLENLPNILKKLFKNYKVKITLVKNTPPGVYFLHDPNFVVSHRLVATKFLWYRKKYFHTWGKKLL